MTSHENGFFEIASSAAVVRRAAVIALIVGVLLALINHGDKILAMEITGRDVVRILLTFLVPYSVSTISSVLAVRERTRSIGGAAVGQ